MGNQNICNICGANYEYRNGRWKCPACGAYKAEELSNEEVTLFYNAAQKLRLCDFDEAEKAYIDIIEKFPKNANGYWGRLLSRYGIKYEEDFDGRKIPTCYAASIESVLSDKDYRKALELADADTKAYFEQQAQYIERVRKEWIERAKKEKPYDIFICYKDSDLANGIDRTQDSIAAQDLYIHLTEQGYRVFFSRESLRDKVGEKYEPYIFNALSTAKVMLVYGTSSEYITSTWLKNEWTRYEKRLQAGEKKPNSLIVACDGFSPAELPKALSSMQCFDATKRSFYTDLDVVLKKIIKGEGKPKPVTKENKEKKKSKKLPVAIATISALIAVFLCILIPNLLNTQPVTSIVDSKYGVVITAQEGVFDKNTAVNVERLSEGTQYESLVSAVNDSKSIELQNAIIYDINCDADINTNVTVKVPYAKDKADSTVKVYYVSDNKSTVEEHSCTYDNGSVEFKTTHFSYYVVGEIVTENDDSRDNQDGNNDNQTVIERIGVRTITFSDKYTVEYALAQWESGEKTEESMISIMDRYGEQQGGGKLHIITPGEFIEEVDTWCFSFERKVGDYAIIENAYGYSLCYISSINPTDTEIEDDSEDGTGDEVTPIPPEVKETTIKFDANGGNGSMSEQTITVGESANLKECSYTKSGYTFSGWATTASGSVVYTDRASFSAESESEITLYAIWTREKFSISFDANGGTGSIDPIEFNSGDSIETPFNTFVKNGYDFIGWSNTKDGTVAYIEGATYTFTSNQTLYAIWRLQEPDKVELIYNANGGTGIMSSQLLLPNQEISLNENMFTRNGYGFRGWSLTPNGEIVYSNMDDFTMGTTSITLYAVWKATDTAIVLNPNGAQGQATTIMSSTDKTITLPLNEFSRDGYTFIGWATTNSGEVIYNNGAEYIAGPNASYNLYAVWQANTNTLYFNANGGSGSMSPLYIQTNVQVQLTENSFTRDGYDFAGWATSPSGNVVYVDKNFYSMGIESSYTLYAVWIEKSTSGLTFERNETGYSVTGYTGNSTSVTIPLNYKGYPITEIGADAFRNREDLSEVILPESITTIGAYSFSNTSITNISLPTSLSKIEDGAFSRCSLLTQIVIPNSVKSIGTYAFQECNKLNKITIGTGLVEMGDAAFTGCTQLQTLEILDGCQQIGYCAFSGCTALTQVSIPSSVTSVESGAFSGCTSLNTIRILGNIETLSNSMFYGCTSLESISLNEGLKEIQFNAFYNCRKITKITIPKTVTTIGESAFNGCIALKDIYFSGTKAQWNAIVLGTNWDNNTGNYNLHCIDLIASTDGTVYYYTVNEDQTTCTITGASSASEIIIPSEINGYTVTSIGTYAFRRASLTSITIPKSVKNIDTRAFVWCNNLTSVYYDGTKAEWEKNGALDMSTIDYVVYCTDAAIAVEKFVVAYSVNGDGTTCTITSGTLLWYNTEINIPDELYGYKVTAIGPSAFAECENLTNITLPNTVISIGENAFNGCTSLTAIIVPDSVTSIGKGAFQGCSSLQSITLPFIGASMDSTAYESVFGYIFGYTSYKGNAVTNPSQISYNYIHTNYGNLPEDTVWQYSYSHAYTYSPTTGYSNYYQTSYYYYIPASLRTVIITLQTDIPEAAFNNCSMLTEIKLPEMVKSVGSYAFNNCANLSKLNISDLVSNINSTVFAGCDKLITTEGGVSYACNWAIACDKNLVSGTIKSGTVGIVDWIFRECQLSNLILPSSLRYIGYGAFSSNTNLDTIKFEGEINLQYIGSSAFLGCDRISKVYIYDLEGWCNIEFGDMQSNPLYGADNLYLNDVLVTDLVIPEGVTQIHNHAFPFYTKLERIILPSTVESIGKQAFYRCEDLERIVIPSSVTSIGSEAFYGCSNLIAVYFTGNESERCQIDISTTSNNYLTNASWYYYSDSQPTDSNYVYWHYVDGVPTKW